MSRWVTTAIALAATFLGGWWLGRYVSRPEIVERVRVDTVFYERPKPINTSDITVSVNVPKLVFARNPVMLHADSGNVASFTTHVAETVTNCNGLKPLIKDYLNIDSVQMEVAVRTLEYRDSTYYARVVGPVVGMLGPRLDYFETYSTTVERVQLVREPYSWEFGPALGSWMTTDGSGVWAGAYARRTFGRFSVSASAGYDPHKKSAFGQIEAGVALWRK